MFGTATVAFLQLQVSTTEYPTLGSIITMPSVLYIYIYTVPYSKSFFTFFSFQRKQDKRTKKKTREYSSLKQRPHQDGNTRRRIFRKCMSSIVVHVVLYVYSQVRTLKVLTYS